MDLFEKARLFTRARALKEQGIYPYFKEIQSGAGAKVMINGREMIMIGSNNYLGLTQHPHVLESAKRAIDQYGSGCTGSRFLNGTLDLHTQLEERLAKFMQTEAVLVFSTGFQSNLGVISTIAGRDDVIFTDRSNHASIVDGNRLSYAKTFKFRHKALDDLERLLKNTDPDAGKLIVTDGVFSMEGDIVDLPELMALARKYGARVLIDDAHSVGVLGKHGRGTTEHFGMASTDVDLIVGTFSKSFASLGGFVAGEHCVIDFLKHHSRSLIFSASMPPPAVAAVLAALDIIEQEPERLEKLWHNVRKMKRGFDDMGFNTGGSQSPIIPIHIGDDDLTFAFWRKLFENGIFTNPAISPAVPPGKGIIRTSYMATHSDDVLDHVLDVFYRIGKMSRIIS